MIEQAPYTPEPKLTPAQQEWLDKLKRERLGSTAASPPPTITEWNREGNMLYTLTPSGKWNRGEPVLANRLTIRVEGDRRYVDQSAVDALTDQILAALSPPPAKEQL